MTALSGDARERLAAEAGGHGLHIGVDQRLVLCTCGWRGRDNAERYAAITADPITQSIGDGRTAAYRRSVETLEARAAALTAPATERTTP